MSQFEQPIATLNATWKSAYQKASAAPASWQPHWPNGSLVVLDEVVETVGYWLHRVRAPTGFSPGFQLAQNLAAASLPALISTAQQLDAGNFNHLPTFANQLVAALSAIHSMVVYSSKEDSLHSAADMQAALASGIAVLGTAQREFAAKTATIEQIDSIASKIREHLAAIEGTAEATNGLCQEVKAAHNEAQTTAQEVRSLSDEIRAAKDELKSLASDANDLCTKMQAQASDLQSLLDASATQSKVIESILPRAASAGLAAAFSSRGAQLEGTKRMWGITFALSLSALAFLAVFVLGKTGGEHEDFWQHLALRVTLAAPLVWLGWFSAVQYGNVVRVQEDYAFKEATSRAFQGYRDHMEHLSTIDAPEAGKALNLLALRTIEILAHEPLRIYGKTDKDASPWHSIADTLTKRTSEKERTAA